MFAFILVAAMNIWTDAFSEGMQGLFISGTTI
jgi:hypothetical protein